MTKILNLTQHNITPEQIDAGVVEPTDKARVQVLLTFDEIPTPTALEARATALVKHACHEVGFKGAVMIGGAPFFMAPSSAHSRRAESGRSMRSRDENRLTSRKLTDR